MQSISQSVNRKKVNLGSPADQKERNPFFRGLPVTACTRARVNSWLRLRYRNSAVLFILMEHEIKAIWPPAEGRVLWELGPEHC